MKTLFTYLFAAGLLAVCLLGFLSMPVDAERQPKAIMPEITLDELEGMILTLVLRFNPYLCV